MTALAAYSSGIYTTFPDDKYILLCDLTTLTGGYAGSDPGVMESLRWFQIQPRTVIGFIGHRESDRSRLQRRLGRAGRRIRFDPEDARFCFPENAADLRERLTAAQQQFQSTGYRVIGALARGTGNSTPEIHQGGSADFPRVYLPARGRNRKGKYSRITLSDLVNEEALPPGIRLCWHGINDRENLRRFLESDIIWGELDIRIDPETERLIARHDSFAESALQPGEQLLPAADTLQEFRREGRHVKIDFKEGGAVVERTLKLLAGLGYNGNTLWFHANTKTLRPEEFRKIARRFPGSIVQTTIDYLASLIPAMPGLARSRLQRYHSRGINQFLLTWRARRKALILDRVQEWGYRLNFYQIPDLEEFLRAVLLLPDAITTDFNFPEWGFFGRGSGQDMRWYQYRS